MKRLIFKWQCVLLVMLHIGANIHAEESNDSIWKITDQQLVSDKYQVENAPLTYNTWLSVGIGGQKYLGAHNYGSQFFKLMSPAFEVGVGKWFTPYIGARGKISGFTLKAGNQSNNVLSKRNFGNLQLDGDLLFNMHNILLGYEEDRKWNSSLHAGVGFLFNYKAHRSKDEETHEIIGNLGWLNTWKMNDRLDLYVDLNGTILQNLFYTKKSIRVEGITSITAGVIYRLGKHKWRRSYRTTVYNESEELALREAIRNKEMANKELSEALKKVVNTDTLYKEEIVVPPLLVTFELDKTDLSEDDCSTLRLFAEVVKKQKDDAVYTISGYADKGTGSSSHNQWLSEQRAIRVYDYLTKELGVDSKCLQKQHLGGVDNMFYDDPTLSRCVIIKGTKKSEDK